MLTPKQLEKLKDRGGFRIEKKDCVCSIIDREDVAILEMLDWTLAGAVVAALNDVVRKSRHTPKRRRPRGDAATGDAGIEE